MTTMDSTWAIVLAAGDGNRLRSLTTDPDGVAVPKQFCSLRGGESLLQETLHRAFAVACPEHVVTIVAESHRRWWQPVTRGLPAGNVVVQPRNRGTGNGILLPILHIVNRDPEARILILPSDHYIGAESVLVSRMQRAAEALDHCEREIILLGISPEEPDPELGYIEPGSVEDAGLRRVQRFVEKPSFEVASALLGRGGVWNSFIMAGRAQAFLDLFAARFPEIVMAMVEAMRTDAEGWASGGLRDLYDDLPDIDFSKHVITGHERRLRLMPVPACGWSDLGTPERVARCLDRLPATTRRRPRASRPPVFVPAFLNLADAHLRVQAGV